MGDSLDCMANSRGARGITALLGIVMWSCDAPPPPPNATVYKDWKVAGNGHWIHLPEAHDVDGSGYLSSFDGLRAIDEHTGDVKWTAPSVPRDQWESVLRVADLVLAYPRALKSDSEPHYLRALDAKTGNPKWQYENFLASSAPIPAGGIVWVLNRASELVSLDVATGKVTRVASLKLGELAADDLGCAIAVSGQTLLVGQGRAGILEGRDLATGGVKWTQKLDGPLRMISLLAQSEAAWIGTNEKLAAVSTESGISTFDAASGKLLWKHSFQLKKYYRASFLLLGEMLFWSDYEAPKDATLHAVEAANGREIWRAGGFAYLEDKEFVHKAGDVWVIPTSARVTVFDSAGKKLAEVDAFTANTAGGQSFASQGESGYTIEAAPPAKKAWEPVQRTTRETSSLITFRLRTGEVVSKKAGAGIYTLGIRNGQLLMVTADGLQSTAVAAAP